MHDIQQGLVHTVTKDRCGNCGHARIAHVDGACMFDSTMFREESVNDHVDCTCERVIEEDPTDVVDGKMMLRITDKKPLDFIKLSFTV